MIYFFYNRILLIREFRIFIIQYWIISIIKAHVFMGLSSSDIYDKNRFLSNFVFGIFR